jgi:type I restriction-modification system DNA methylase subunit
MKKTEIIKHLRERAYMSGVQRDQSRIKATGEVFTPTELVREILDKLKSDSPEQFTSPTKTFLDPSCGDGQFLSEVLIRKIEHLSEDDIIDDKDFEIALSTIYGVDLMIDNVRECRTRLLCNRTDLIHIVEKNIVCHDALTYDYSFNGTNMTDAEKQKMESDYPFEEQPRTKKTKSSKKIITMLHANPLFVTL